MLTMPTSVIVPPPHRQLKHPYERARQGATSTWPASGTCQRSTRTRLKKRECHDPIRSRARTWLCWNHFPFSTNPSAYLLLKSFFVEWHIIHQVMVFLGLEFEEALLTYPVRSDQIGIHKRSSFVGSPATEDSL